MPSDKPVTQEAPPPGPRRRKWLRRLLILGCCLLFLFIVWAILQLWLGSAFQREVDALRARGEPTSLAEMAPRKVLPPDQDAAVLVRRAVAIYDANVKPLLDAMEAAVKAAGYCDTSGSGLAFDPTLPADHPELLAEFPSEVAAIREAAGPMVELLRKARGLDSYDLGVDFRDPFGIGSNMVLNFSKKRAMARFLHLLAAEAHHRGDDAEAAQRLRDLFTLSRDVAQCPTLISELVDMSIEAMAESQNPAVLHQLRIGSGPNDPARKAAKELMAFLLDPNRPRERWVRCMVGERAFSCTETGAVLSGSMSQAALAGYQNIVVRNPALRALFHPALGSDAAAYLRGLSSAVAAAGQDDYPSAVARLDFPRPRQSTVGQLLHPFTGWAIGYSKAMQLHFRGVAGLRMAGTAIAVRMYELDRGRPLARLEDLVPDYLPALPKDPFDANGGPIHMGRWGGRDLLYSLGGAGKDLGGQYATDPNGSLDFDQFNWPCFLRGDGLRYEIVKRAPQTSPADGPGLPTGLPAESAPRGIKP